MPTAPRSIWCAVVAGRRRTGGVSGGRLRGGRRSRHPADVGRRHLDRRDQLRHHRRQSAPAMRCPPARILGTGQRRRWLERVVRPDARRRDRARLRQSVRGGPGHVEAACPAFSGRASSRPYLPGRDRRGDELVRYRRAQGDARAVCRLRPDQCRARRRFSVGAVNVRTGNFAYFDNATDKIRPEHIMASGRPAARPSRRSRSTANIIGTAAWCRTRRSTGSCRRAPTSTRWSCRSTCGAPAATCRATSPGSRCG